MSLLLDAIKKAEQREKKLLQQNEPPVDAADETLEPEVLRSATSPPGTAADQTLNLSIDAELLDDSAMVPAQSGSSQPVDQKTDDNTPEPDQSETGGSSDSAPDNSLVLPEDDYPISVQLDEGTGADLSTASGQMTTSRPAAAQQSTSLDAPSITDDDPHSIDWPSPTTGFETAESVIKTQVTLAAEAGNDLEHSGDTAGAAASGDQTPLDNQNPSGAESIKQKVIPEPFLGALEKPSNWSPFRFLILLLVALGGVVAFYLVASLNDHQTAQTTAPGESFNVTENISATPEVDTVGNRGRQTRETAENNLSNSSPLDMVDHSDQRPLALAGRPARAISLSAHPPVQPLAVDDSPPPDVNHAGYPAGIQKSATDDNKTGTEATPSPQTAHARETPESNIGTHQLRLLKNTTTTVDKLQKEAEQAFNNRDYATAQELYSRWLEKRPEAVSARFGIAATALLLSNPDDAREQYEKILQQQPKNASAQAGLLNLLRDQTGNSSALKALHDRDPDDDYLNYLLGNHHAQIGQWDEAQRYYFNAHSNSPGNAAYAFNLAVSLERIGQPRAALDYYQRATIAETMPLTAEQQAQVSNRIIKLGGKLPQSDQ